MLNFRRMALLLPMLLLIACQQAVQSGSGTATTVETIALQENASCSGRFVRHELDHITTNAYEPVDMYDSNGAGVALSDLDQDGDTDIVLANLARNNQIFWNEGGLNFRSQELTHGSSRAVAAVDVDADGWQDIVFTTRVGTPLVWRNNDGEFERSTMVGVDEQSYSMAWGDLDNDGDLDLVTGSYDTALEKELRDAFMFGDGAGVFAFTNQGDGTFTSERLAETSQALAIQLFDVDADGRLDVLVGNDFITVRDMAFLNSEDGWVSAEPFQTTTENTMSFDVADVDNNGSLDLFAADMHPYEGESEDAWMPVMELMMAAHTPVEGDPQVMANVLLMRDEDGNYVDDAPAMQVDATGWSWSTKFGDLDQDGFLDLYSVNGMASAETFGHLPDYTLIEENQALRNNGAGQFNAMPDWGLNQTDGGRGMSMADLDGDGDLDVVINNFLGPATILENQLCEGESLLVDLKWPGSQNPFAIGATVTLQTDKGDLLRNVRAISGYLSGDTPTVHFGFPTDTKIGYLEITWPDGEVSSLPVMAANQKLVIERQ